MLLGASITESTYAATAAGAGATSAGFVIDAQAIETFLSRILPTPRQNAVISINAPFTMRDGKKAYPGQGFDSYKEAANHIAYWLRAECGKQGRPATDYYHTMSLQAGAVMGQTRSGRPQLRTSRRQSNAVALKALFLDLDTKPEKGGYKSKAEALGALLPLVQDGRVPAPTMVVDSGNGLHVYWVLSREMDAATWTALATGFGNYLWREGINLGLGDSFFADSARLLRPPGTYNCKDPANPKPVRVVGKVRVDDYDPSTFEKYKGTLPPNHRAAVSVLPGSPGAQPALASLPPGIMPAGPPIKSELAAGIGDVAQPVDMAKVAAACEVLKDILARGGNGDPEPLWHLAILASTFAEDGRKWAHRFSDQDPRYVPADTDAKFDTSMATRLSRAGAVGWPGCAKFNLYSPKCASCQYAGKVRSPLNTGKDDSDLPQGYYRKDGTIWKDILTGSGQAADIVPTEIFAYGIRDAFIESTIEGPVLNVQVHVRNEPPQRVRLPLPAINMWRDAVLSILGAHGVTMPKKTNALAQEFFVSFVQELQRAATMTAKREAFGWTKTRSGTTGFAFGGRIITGNGSVEDTGVQDPVLAHRYTPRGTLDAWKRCAAFIIGTGRVELATILATAFAGPLVRFTGQSGVLVNAYSPRSGVQKSSAMEVGMAVWGHPKLAMNRIDDTGNSVANKLGVLRNVTVMWDELQTDAEKDAFVKLAFALTQGTEKSRLTADARQRQGGAWATMLVSASNFSLQDEMTRKARNTAAGLNRVLEFVVTPPSAAQLTSVAAAEAALMPRLENYGRAGEVYAAALVRDEALIPGRLEKLTRGFEQSIKAIPEERFWLHAAATILLGAAIARAEGLVAFDLAAMRTFLLEVIREQRRAKQHSAVDVTGAEYAADVLNRYIAWARRQNQCLETDVMPRPGARGRQAAVQLQMPSEEARKSLRSPVVHIARMNGTLRILAHEFHEWLWTEKIPQRPVVDALREHGGLIRHRITWAAGTEYTAGQAQVYDVTLRAGTGPAHGIGNLFDWGSVVGAPQTGGVQ